MRAILLLVFALSAQSALAEVSESLANQTYEVRHRSGQTLFAAISAVSPYREGGRVFHGHTDWHVSWRFWWNERPDGACTFTSVKTTVTGTIGLPALISTDKSALEQFGKYTAALRIHEQGHYKFGTDAAHEIDRRISALPTMASCSTLESEANRIGHQILEDYQARERAYDIDTQHGRTQGAWLSY